MPEYIDWQPILVWCLALWIAVGLPIGLLAYAVGGLTQALRDDTRAYREDCQQCDEKPGVAEGDRHAGD